jgi:hypothetical protein
VVLVTSTIDIGTTSSAGASGLRLWICYQQSGGTLTEPHPVDWLDVQAPPSQQTNVYTLTDTIAGLAPGSYTVGMCGQQSPTVTNNWNASDWSYATAQVIQGASILTGASSLQAQSARAHR